MTKPIIQVEELSKRYRLGQIGVPSFRESVKKIFSRAVKDGGGAQDETGKELWALHDVSFEVMPGEVLGVIGRNGAGKSTLLKVLSRITEPTSGRAIMHGRLASLLEVGTGFHPELTGRENIFLNGAILGMRKAEIARRLDEIIAFSEVERFLDTPVKHYSSGMYVRLAFAVAAHLEPEILIVDEVLAVGDAAFQKKCLGKMHDVAEGGRTVLFVSHNMAAVKNLCSRCIWLHDGRIEESGDTEVVTDNYLRRSLCVSKSRDLENAIKSLPNDPVFKLDAVKICQNGIPAEIVLNNGPLVIEMRFTVAERVSGLRLYFDLIDEQGTLLVRSFHDEQAKTMSVFEPGKYLVSTAIPADLLAPRNYEIQIGATVYNLRSCIGGGINIPISVERANGLNGGYPGDPIRAALQPRFPWQMEVLVDEVNGGGLSQFVGVAAASVSCK